MADCRDGGRLNKKKAARIQRWPRRRDDRLFEGFARGFQEPSQEVGKPRQYLVPYYIASHPGSDLHAMIDLAVFLKHNGYRPDQVQDFIPSSEE